MRLREALRFYRTALPLKSFSYFYKLGKTLDPGLHGAGRVRVIAFCIMPTHFHLFLEQLVEDGISDYLKYISHGYAVYFNKKIHRLGHLWESKFKSVLVEEDAYALHLTRYIHLNPVSAGLAGSPESWEYSSYLEYLHRPNGAGLCDPGRTIGMSPEAVRRFTEDRADYQRSLQTIKHLLLD
jgi:putative transposase